MKWREHPSPLKLPTLCIMEALQIVLDNNVCQYTDGDNKTIYASPNHGTAMGPAHSCDYVDVFMGELDVKLVDSSPVPLISSLLPVEAQQEARSLDWSRFRDDGITLLLDPAHVPLFERHLQALNPPNIRWTVTHGREACYLDIRLTIAGGQIITDVFSKHSHSYLSPASCHAPTVFKGLISSVGTRLRMICSEDATLEGRILEYAKYFTMAGWSYSKAKSELEKGARKNRKALLTQPRKKKGKKVAWVTTFDPRLPSKSEIIRRNMPLLYANPVNKEYFPKNLIISADRRRKNLAEIYKPTVPRRYMEHGPQQEPGYFPCRAKRCDTCRHGRVFKSFQSPWDARWWRVRQHLDCRSDNVVYLLKCKIHPTKWYTGSTVNLRSRWANHKSDCKLKKVRKCNVALHVNSEPHPADPELDFLEIVAIETVPNVDNLLRREVYWRCNLGTHLIGLNTRSDFKSFKK